MPELLLDEQVRLLAAARNSDGSRRFYPAGLHPATHRLREYWRLLDALPETPERDEALAYVEHKLATFEAVETEAKRRYLATVNVEGPWCECGNCPGHDVRLPMDAWDVAGAAGEGKAASGTDLFACAPGHVPDGTVVLDARGDWVVCGVPG